MDEPPLFTTILRKTPGIALSSRGGQVVAVLDRHANRIVIRGGNRGGHCVGYNGPEDAMRVVTHFSGYCRNNKVSPMFDGWCLAAVAKQLSVHILTDRILGLL